MELKQLEKKLNYNFAAIQGFYWAAFCSCGSFASVFLLSRNFDNRQIGAVLALSNIFAVILQPLAASYADRAEKVTLKQIMAAVGFITVSLSAVLLVIPDVFCLLAVLFVLILTGVLVEQPLVRDRKSVV